MSHIDGNRRKPARALIAMGAVILILASLGLAACGESSGTTSTSANASATTPRGGTGPGGSRSGGNGPGGARFKALRECLQKNGITLPQRPSGQRRGGPGGASGPRGFLGGGGGAGAQQLPNGVTRAQMQAAIKKCGGGEFRRGGTRLKSPAYQAALTKFAACMRENGVNIPAPNTSGSGPIFSTKGLNTAGAQFQAAEKKCRSDLSTAFQRTSGTDGPTSAPGGGPPRGNEAPGGAGG